MKINEKNLVAIASGSNLATDKEGKSKMLFILFHSLIQLLCSGYLNKRGEVNKNFQKRWFVLKGNLLYYFEKKTDKEPIGVIIVEGCTVGKWFICLHLPDTPHKW